MPAASPPIPPSVAARLAALGRELRARRKQLGVSAIATAEAAGMSRMTLHRLERGEPSVAVGAFLAAAASLGLDLALVDPLRQGKAAPAALPASIVLKRYPQLKRLAWQLKGTTELAPRDALDLYERNWRHVDQAAMKPREKELVRLLADAFRGGRLLV